MTSFTCVPVVNYHARPHRERERENNWTFSTYNSTNSKVEQRSIDRSPIARFKYSECRKICATLTRASKSAISSLKMSLLWLAGARVFARSYLHIPLLSFRKLILANFVNFIANKLAEKWFTFPDAFDALTVLKLFRIVLFRRLCVCSSCVLSPFLWHSGDVILFSRRTGFFSGEYLVAGHNGIRWT